MELSSAREQLLIAYTAEPGTTSHDALNLLASWSAEDEGVRGDPATTTNEH
jgi:hypothetical protein